MSSAVRRAAPASSLLPKSSRDEKHWALQQMAGRLVELSGAGATALLTAAFGLVLDAQRHRETVGWVSLAGSHFFPPDASGSGVDLDSLAVIRVPDPLASARAALHLLRSGAFGLVVLDLACPARSTPSSRPRDLPLPIQTKMVGLAHKHDAAVLVLTSKTPSAPSVGSLVSLRADVQRSLTAPFEVRITILKDKRRGPGKIYRELCSGPAGLR